MYNDEQLAHLRSEARRRENQSPSGVLTRESFLRHLHSLADATVSADALHPSEVVLAEHDAALRSRPLPPEVEAAETHRVEADHRCCLDLLRSARLYFADGHPMRLAIERTLAERPGRSSACAGIGEEGK